MPIQVKDIQLDSTGDLLIKNGDFICDYSDEQHVIDIINSYAGWWKQFPLVGVGIQLYKNARVKAEELKNLIQLQLKSDNYQVDSVTVDAQYNVNVKAVRLK